VSRTGCVHCSAVALLLGTAAAWIVAFRTSGLVVPFLASLNLWMSFVHYALTALIWKIAQPATAAALVCQHRESSAAALVMAVVLGRVIPAGSLELCGREPALPPEMSAARSRAPPS